MTWSCTYWLAPIMLRMRFAFSGTSMPSASSTARTEVSAWTVVQTPQMRWVQIHASRAAVDLGFDAQVPFNPGNWIDYDSCHMSLLGLAFL